MVYQEILTFTTQGRGTLDITNTIAASVNRAGTASGICNLFIQHTSASLIICENADKQVRRDLEAFMARLVPDGDSLFKHTDEGEDDMPAHIRSILTQTSLVIPLQNHHLLLGTWQGIYLWEHRLAPHKRQVVVTVLA